MAQEIPSRRAGDVPLYTQTDVDRIRERDRDEARYSTLVGQVGELRGAVGKLPLEFEATARRVFAEQMAALRKEHTATSWRWYDGLLAFGQLVIAAAVVAIAILK